MMTVANLGRLSPDLGFLLFGDLEFLRSSTAQYEVSFECVLLSAIKVSCITACFVLDCRFFC